MLTDAPLLFPPGQVLIFYYTSSTKSSTVGLEAFNIDSLNGLVLLVSSGFSLIFLITLGQSFLHFNAWLDGVLFRTSIKKLSFYS